STRQGQIVVGGATVRITQEGQAAPSCTFDVSPRTVDFDASAGESQVRVTTNGSCAWTATTEAPWLSIDPSRGTGSENVRISAGANTTGAPRTAAVTIAGVVVTVTQEGAAPAEVVVDGRIRDLSGACPVVTFDVRGSTVITSQGTSYQPSPQNCASLADGAQVVVSGIRGADGRIAATRITISGGSPTP
ncbi:MAG: hypothetical protein EHM13_08105, partial [Acidobacteria bacterium]